MSLCLLTPAQVLISWQSPAVSPSLTPAPVLISWQSPGLSVSFSSCSCHGFLAVSLLSPGVSYSSCSCPDILVVFCISLSLFTSAGTELR